MVGEPTFRPVAISVAGRPILLSMIDRKPGILLSAITVHSHLITAETAAPHGDHS